MIEMMSMMMKKTKCLPRPLISSAALLALLDVAIAAIAFIQLLRIHFRSHHLGWTRQKIFHLIIASSNIGYFIYFTSSILATCGGWQCWLHGCGFILMASPQILFLSAFLLLLSFWVDLCHQARDEEEDDESGITESFLENISPKSGTLHLDGRRRCCYIRNIHIGSRQKCVILVTLLTFVLMAAFALLIWLGKMDNPIDSSVVATVYQCISSAAMLLLGGALACYGFLLFSKMRKVRSDMASTETWKVASLASVTLACFTSCSVLAFATNIHVLSYCHSEPEDAMLCSILVFLYFFIGFSVPSGFVLWVMREMPVTADNTPRTRSVVTFVRDTSSTHNPQWRNTVASSQNKALKASPI